MKTTAKFLVSAIAAGAGTGFLMSLLLAPVKTEANQASFRTSGLSVRNLVSAVEENQIVRAVEQAMVKFAAPTMAARPVPGSAVMLLSEPVVVLTPEYNGWQRLEAGQQVTLIANQGRFIRVKYEDKEVSIPRTAVTQGIASIR